MLKTRNTIGFKPPKEKDALILPNTNCHTEQDVKFIHLLHLTQKLDEMMTNFSKSIVKQKPFVAHKGKELNKLLDKFYVKYYEPL